MRYGITATAACLLLCGGLPAAVEQDTPEVETATPLPDIRDDDDRLPLDSPTHERPRQATPKPAPKTPQPPKLQQPTQHPPKPQPPTPDPDAGTRLEDMPEVEPLPDWLIDIPQGGSAAVPPRQLQQYVQADERVVSPSHMFAVSGGDALRMGAIANHADELRARLVTLLKLERKWKYRVNIRLLGNTADAPTPRPIRTRVSLMEGKPSLQILIFAGGGISIEKLDAAIITMLLYEYAMRDVEPDALPDYLELPPWLITGIHQAILWEQDRADRKLYRSLFNRPEMLSPENIINTSAPEKLDAMSRQYYDVSCGVLIMSLLHRKSGPERLRSLLREALTQEGKMEDILAAHFHAPEDAGNSLSKWWALELSALAQPRTMETLTPIESENSLKEALVVTTVDKDTRVPHTISAADTTALLKLPAWKDEANKCIGRLSELQMHCFPGYRSIISEYIRALGELVRGAKVEDVQKILIPLDELRKSYMEASIRGRDYLDWFEITQMGDTHRPGFDTYAESMRLLRRDPPGARTPISRYLDDIEALHTLKPGDELPKRLRPATPRRKP